MTVVSASLFSLSLVPLIWTNCCFFCVKVISKVRHLITIVWISVEKGMCFDFNYFWSLITKNCLVLICRKLLFLQSFTQYFTTKNSTYSIWCGSHNVSFYTLALVYFLIEFTINVYAHLIKKIIVETIRTLLQSWKPLCQAKNNLRLLKSIYRYY